MKDYRAISLVARQNKQWLQLTLDLEYERLHRLSYNCFPLNFSEDKELSRLRNELCTTKNKKFAHLLAAKRKDKVLQHSKIMNNCFQTDLTQCSSKANHTTGFVNLTEKDLPEEMMTMLNNGPSFVPSRLTKQALQK